VANTELKVVVFSGTYTMSVRAANKAVTGGYFFAARCASGESGGIETYAISLLQPMFALNTQEPKNIED
jgi:hypothetical protein